MIEIIKEYRLRANIPFKELAHLVGVKFQTLHKNLVTGHAPNERTAYRYSEFVRKNQVEIERVLGRKITVQ